jgi:hypothetical protein
VTIVPTARSSTNWPDPSLKTHEPREARHPQAILIDSGRFPGFLPTHCARPWVEARNMRAVDHLGLEWRSTFRIATRARPVPPRIVRAFQQDLEAAAQ